METSFSSLRFLHFARYLAAEIGSCDEYVIILTNSNNLLRTDGRNDVLCPSVHPSIRSSMNNYSTDCKRNSKFQLSSSRVALVNATMIHYIMGSVLLCCYATGVRCELVAAVLVVSRTGVLFLRQAWSESTINGTTNNWQQQSRRRNRLCFSRILDSSSLQIIRNH